MQQSRHILISGSSGFIGSALKPFLRAAGYRVSILIREDSDSADEIRWKPGETLDPACLPRNLQVVINLSGSSIAVPFTEANRRRILQSRLKSTQTLVDAVLAMQQKPVLFINASGIGFYGDRADELLTEQSTPGEDFVADVCVQWENAMTGLADSGIRTAALRTGLVMDPSGGALAKMLPAFRAGAGAILGSGAQYMSWISLRDYLRSLQFIIEHDSLRGPINLVSPDPVSNAEFSRQLAHALGRPLLLRAPAWALKLAMGEMARLLLLAGQRVEPQKLLSAGFTWEDSGLESTFSEFFRE